MTEAVNTGTEAARENGISRPEDSPNYIFSETGSTISIYHQILSRASVAAAESGQILNPDDYLFLSAGHTGSLLKTCDQLGVPIDTNYIYPVDIPFESTSGPRDQQIVTIKRSVASFALLPKQYILDIGRNVHVRAVFIDNIVQELEGDTAAWKPLLDFAHRKLRRTGSIPKDQLLELENNRKFLLAHYDSAVNLFKVGSWEIDQPHNRELWNSIEDIMSQATVHEELKVPESAMAA